MSNVAEKYASAITSKNLTPDRVGQTDIDVLISAGWVTAKDRRKATALAVYRAGVTGDMAGIGTHVETLADWLAAHFARGGRKPMKREHRRDLCRRVLDLWFNPTCRSCDGLGYGKMDGAPMLSVTECHVCHGTTKRPIDSVLKADEHEAGRWVAAQLDQLVAGVHSEMARLLNTSIQEIGL